MRLLISFVLLFFSQSPIFTQKPTKPTPADLHQAIKKLNVLGSVLYVAAHPDDENQRLISYCANHKLYDVTYLSLTRGDGGQNLIGPELRELLGVLRTQELLMARSIDGGKQRFTRANDFGYSKNPEETTSIWNRDEVLSDVVWAIRETQPDIIFNRFHHDKKFPNHGHHTTSAMLSLEAFDLANNPEAYPEQLSYTSTWQPKRLFFNTSWWFFGSKEKFNAADKSNMFELDLGVFLPLKGKSNNEISAEARSMHRCQGFGEITKRGENLEYLDFVKGEKPANKDLFEGINTSWSRVPGGEKIGSLLSKIDQSFRSDNPAASIPDLLTVLQMIEALPDGHWKRVKQKETKEVIKGCMGLYLEAVADQAIGTPGATVEINLEAIQRSTAHLILNSISFSNGIFDTTLNWVLPNNFDWTWSKNIQIPPAASFTSPFWLQSAGTTGMYTVPDQKMRNLAETPRFLTITWSFLINNIPVSYTTDVAYKTEEPAKGEVWKPFDILPPAVISFEQSAYLFTSGPKEITVRIKALRDSVSGTADLVLPTNWSWKSATGNTPFFLPNKGQETLITFLVTPPVSPENADAKAILTIGGRNYSMQLSTIEYEHIPAQNVLLPAQVKISKLDLTVAAQKIGYYMGAGDDVPNALRLMGCQVTLLEDKDLDAKNLAQYEAVVIGIRAYNTKNALAIKNNELFEYVNNGGTLITQYNNNFDYTAGRLAPIPLKLSRTRVTDETAEMRFLIPEHPVLNYPNKLTNADFNDWVQERGLYFPGEWDSAYSAPLSCNDPGEKPADGGLLVAPWGKGVFAYTSFSFFRELPAGVPGAYRLFANLVSLKQPLVKP